MKLKKKQLLNIISEELTLFLKEKQEEAKAEPIAKNFSSVFVEALELGNPTKEKQIQKEVYEFLKGYTLNENNQNQQISEAIRKAYNLIWSGFNNLLNKTQGIDPSSSMGFIRDGLEILKQLDVQLNRTVSNVPDWMRDHLNKNESKSIKENQDIERPSDAIAIAYVRAYAKKHNLVWESFKAEQSRLNRDATRVTFITKKGPHFMDVMWVGPESSNYNNPMATKIENHNGFRLYGEW